jgi:outer membrane immunogenic protein
VTKAPAMVPPYNWTGFYLGINGGYGFGRSNWDGLPASLNVTGAMAGGQLGYNWQFGQFVYGLEGDGDWTNLRGTANPTDCSLECQTKNDFLATARGRLGIAADRLLPYVTGGLEVALTGNWTAKAEYLYVDLGRTGCNIDCGLPAGNNVGLTSNVVRGGINYRF